MLVFAVRFPPPRLAAPASRLVAGSVVIADDYFKSLLAGLYSFFGGPVRSYESLLDRARREAVLRMKAEARPPGGGGVGQGEVQTIKKTPPPPRPP
ncbi:MAG: YbjQ family protein, partial [Betaproteobacteria bacterium]